MDDPVTWLQNEAISAAIGVALTAAALGMLALVKKVWRRLFDLVRQYGTIFCGIFLVIWLLLLLIGNEDRAERQLTAATEQFEAILGQQQNALEQALEQLAATSVEKTAEPAQAMPQRPYFTVIEAAMRKVAENMGQLTVSVRNNSIPAEEVISHLLVALPSLNADKPPLNNDREESSNPIGPGGGHSHHWRNVEIPANATAVFVVFQMRYVHALIREEFSHIWFFVFGGASEDGNYEQTLTNASRDQKEAILRYMEKRGIAKL